jgi:ATP-dependent protease ClpP protease subunit
MPAGEYRVRQKEQETQYLLPVSAAKGNLRKVEWAIWDKIRIRSSVSGILTGSFGTKEEQAVMEEQERTEQRQEDPGTQQILEFGSSLIHSKRGAVHVLTIVGQIEGHQVLPPSSKSTKYEHVMPLLALVEESDEVDGLLVLLNTVGGDIEAGLGIAELIASMSKPTVSLVLGGGHSIGVPLAVSAKRSFIAPSAAMTIHPVRLNGLVIGVPQTFYYFERIQERITQFVTANSRVKREDFTRLMLQTGELAADVGSVIYGEEAVQLGLIDEIGGLSAALDCLHRMIRERKESDAP